MSRISTRKFIRKPLYVDAVRITGANFDDVAAWCQGEVQQDEVPGKGTGKKYIKVRVHNPKNPRQTKAFVGDWLLYTERGYKVYTNKAFHASFDQTPAGKSINEAADEARAAAGVEAEANAREYPEETTIGGTPREDINVSDTSFSVPETAERATDLAEDVLEGKLTMNGAREQMGMPLEQPDPNPQRVLDHEAEQEKVDPAAVEGKRVLSVEEQKELTTEEIRQLVQSGEAVLAQEVAA